MRRHILATIAASLVLVVVAGCGGESATPSPSDTSETVAPITTEAPIVTPTEPATEATPAPASAKIMYSACANVAVRKGPASDEGLVVRVGKGTKVKVVDTVTGASYDATKCGESGDQWLKITRIGGKSVLKQYDLEAVYAAAGFFGEGRP
jgi:uncharacterized protein YgiM (DUF1202 family)